MKKQKTITWYLSSNDSNTNKIISTEVSEENMIFSKMCHDNVDRNLWECNRRIVSRIVKSKNHQNLDFEVLKKTGDGPIKLCDFSIVKNRVILTPKT